MSKLSSILRGGQDGRLSFFCPGCKDSHTIRVGAPERPNWSWNGNAEAPTFSPSILVTSGHFVRGHEGDCWCTYNRDHPEEPSRFSCGICHSFVTDGKIQFLGDCTHALAGQTVPLPAWPENYDYF